jgi:hypothetical protein
LFFAVVFAVLVVIPIAHLWPTLLLRGQILAYLLFVAYEVPNPIWYPRIELEFVNKTGQDISIDLSDFDQLEPWIEPLLREMVLRTEGSPKSEFQTRNEVIIYRYRYEGPVELQYVELDSGLAKIRQIDLKHPTFGKCRFVLVLHEESVQSSGCERRIHTLMD